MGTDGEKSKHNPDGDNLKSLLKKTGKKDAKKSNRVVFNETKNEFFDADYIILIREECDFDDEDDESVCTCYQHEMVRLTCCEPNCDCAVFEEVVEHTPQSPKFAPPMEFVDAVTLSPPEGYKDMELEEQQEMMAYKQMRRAQRTAVCKECSANQEHEGDKGDNCEPNSDNNKPKIDLEDEENEKEKIDQSQQTTPTSPNNSDGQSYMLDSSMDEEKPPEDVSTGVPMEGSPVSGILKGGRLWRQLSKENNTLRLNDQLTKTDSVSDDENSTTRTVRFIEEEKKDSCKTSPEADPDLQVADARKEEEEEPPSRNGSPAAAVEPTEMMLTFKLGNHVLISNNSLKPNSAVRQLFPCTKPMSHKEEEQQYLVTAESLRAFEEAKRSKLPQIIQSAGTNDSIKRVIERNTLRRSLVRYEPKSRKNVQKTDNSLVERIKQLTCDIDEVNQDSDELSARVSPTGEEGNTVDASQIPNKCKERNFSPSSSSTTSSSSSSMSSTYRKITDLFGKRDKLLENPAPNVTYEPKAVQTQTLPDLGGPYQQEIAEKMAPKHVNPSNESRKQFLSTLAPLTACVSNVGHPDDHYYHLSNHGSMGSSTGSEYTLEDIDEALVNEENKKITPDVLAGTPASESGDELVVFVQQDANRIERIKKKYENDSNTKKDDDDEHDDYGFNRRPSVRGIKPRFGSTTEILQQIQNQIHLPTPNANIAWPYYSETGLNRDDDSNRVNAKQNATPHYQTLPAEARVGGYRPVLLQDNQYQNCGNQTCYKEVYKTQASVIGVEIDCQTMPKNRNGRPMSPPPQELSRNFHQTMVYIPYNHIESYQPVVSSNAYPSNDYYRYNQNQMNKKYVEPMYQQKMPAMDEQYCLSNVPQHKVLTKSPYSNSYQPLLVPSSRSESPLLGNFAMARSTQTSMACLSSCNYYQTPGTILRYKESVPPPYKPEYVNKVNRHSFPSVRPRYNPPDNSDHIYMEDPNIQHNGQIMNGYYNYFPSKDSPGNSPTKARFIERGVPEGAASVSPQDSINLQNNSSTNTSPTLVHSNPKPLFYAMNV